MDILEFYTKVLNSLGCEVDDLGLVSLNDGEYNNPLFVEKGNKDVNDGNGRRLILPTKSFLDNPDWKCLQPFHPLSESIVKGESLIIKEMKKLMYLRITTITQQLAFGLLDIAVDKDKHKKLKPAQSEFLKLVPNVNEKTITNLGKIFHTFNMNGERRLVSIYLRRGGILNEVSYKRLSVISFPLTNELNKEDRDIYDVKLTIAEKAAIVNLFYYLLPAMDQDGEYNFGSKSDYAPHFHALCGSFIKVMKSLNRVILIFKDKLDDQDLLTDVSWEEDLEDLFKFYNVIPPLPGNEGDSVKSNEPVQGQAIPNNMVVNTSLVNNNVQAPISNISFSAPVPPVVNEVVTEDGKVAWNSIVSRNPQLANQNFNPGFGGMQQPQVPPGGFAGYDRGMPTMPQYGNSFQNNSILPSNSRI